jgi:hypothetical protein
MSINGLGRGFVSKTIDDLSAIGMFKNSFAELNSYAHNGMITKIRFDEIARVSSEQLRGTS